MIEKSVVEEILARVSIEDVISPYVSLKRAGSLLKGLCPFHGEKTPSFCAYPKDNSFYCFGCGAGGDAITFVRRIENVEFEDAVEILAKRVGCDPAVMANPFITTIVDVMSLLVYFGMAKILLGL